MYKIFISLFLCVGLTACGHKGDLFLPDGAKQERPLEGSDPPRGALSLLS